MKRLALSIALAALVLGGGAVAVVETAQAKEEAAVKQVLHHNVLFRYKAEVTEEQKQEVIKRFAALKDKIDLILDFSGGKNIEGENLSGGFEHVFTAIFAGTAERDAYLVHPAHKEFGAFVGPLIDKVIVGDYLAPAN